ncbi:hypothetical protein FEK47_24430 [Escherichia sp. E3659]|uniref:scabin-related ADP-ribosyltransferase n=1 Tax=unclassified Escherichia TaxID=2608889 RepID=UPI001081DEFD|nr:MULTISPECIES: hypothetical protein [unclassified Escherichia]TGB80774.1 hypothetical protein CRI67_00220 [Escherichia sp. E4702]TLJ02676.1 hypothetical protein FEK47_24430 [Escherichia sp. E3659]
MKIQDSSFGVFFVRILKNRTSQGIKYHLTWQSAEFDSQTYDRNIYDKIVCYQVYDATTDTCIIDNIKKDTLIVDITSYVIPGRKFIVKTVIQHKEGEYEIYPQDSPALPVFVPDIQYVPSHDLTHPKYPLWINEMSAAERDKLENADFFKQWLSTTTTLYPDLRKCRDYRGGQPNPPQIPLWDLKWRNDDFFLFHGNEEGRPIAEIKQQGLTPPEIDGDPFLHQAVHYFCTESTTYSFACSTLFAAQDSTVDAFDKGPRNRYVYMINAPGGVDVDKSTMAPESELEIAFLGGVDAQYIIGAFTFKIDPESEVGMELTDFTYMNREAFPQPPEGKCHIILAIQDYANTNLTVYSNGININEDKQPYLTVDINKMCTFVVESENKYNFFINGEKVSSSAARIYNLKPADHLINGVVVFEYSDLPFF